MKQKPKEITLEDALEALPKAKLDGFLKVREPSTAPGGVELVQEWCECEDSTFLCYPEDGTCRCGEWKHHVHCVCGKISQTG